MRGTTGWTGIIAAVAAGTFAEAANAGNIFVYAPPENTIVGSALGPFTPGQRVNDNSGMNDSLDPEGADKLGLHDNLDSGQTMWLSDNAPVANGSDAGTTAYVTLDFGLPVNIDELLIWNYNQENPAAPNLFLRGLRQVDITYSTGTDTSGLGNTLYDNLVLNPATGMNGLAYTDDLALGTPGVGVDNVRAVRISAQGGAGVGNHGGSGGAELYYGLSEVRFFTSVPEPASLALLGVGGLLFTRRRAAR